MFKLTTQPEVIQYYHAASGFPTKRTWLKAIKNRNYTLWSGFTAEAVQKHFPESEETQKGHMHKQPSSIQSTKVQFKMKPTNENKEEDNDDAKAEADKSQQKYKKH